MKNINSWSTHFFSRKVNWKRLLCSLTPGRPTLSLSWPPSTSADTSASSLRFDMFSKYKKNIRFVQCCGALSIFCQTLLLEPEPTFLILNFAALNLIKANDENILSRESELKWFRKPGADKKWLGSATWLLFLTHLSITLTHFCMVSCRLQQDATSCSRAWLSFHEICFFLCYIIITWKNLI